MSLHHAVAGEVIDVRPLGEMLTETPSTALVRTPDLEVMRLVLLRGKSVPEHQVAGEITLLCMEGTVEVQAHGKTQALQAGQMIYLRGHEPYALLALEDSSLLMTMLRGDETMSAGTR